MMMIHSSSSGEKIIIMRIFVRLTIHSSHIMAFSSSGSMKDAPKTPHPTMATLPPQPAIDMPTEDGFWTRLAPKEEDEENGSSSSSMTGRCGFSWHVASCLLLWAVFWLVARTSSSSGTEPDDDAVNNLKNHHPNDSSSNSSSSNRAELQLLASFVTVVSTSLPLLFVAAPMIYFVINSATASTV